jgi:hypothetical protein
MPVLVCDHVGLDERRVLGAEPPELVVETEVDVLEWGVTTEANGAFLLPWLPVGKRRKLAGTIDAPRRWKYVNRVRAGRQQR